VRSETPRPRKPGVFNREGLPIIGTFLIWGTGSGAQTLARPLFAYDVAGSVFLVTVLIAALAAGRMISGPLTGYLADHWGRKPMAVAGAAIRGTASALVIFTDNYAQFFVLEFVGAIGVSM
jgi:MFS family permease